MIIADDPKKVPHCFRTLTPEEREAERIRANEFIDGLIASSHED